ncbi:MAG: cytochrome c3 family protein, partial [Methylophilus sp.]
MKLNIKHIATTFMLICMMLLLAMPLQAARYSRTKAQFDHAKTGFTLNGAHINARCESCHVNGLFKGTPKDCVGCHQKSSRMNTTSMPMGHMATKNTCQSCHVPASWTPAVFSHEGVLAGTACASCHDGKHAIGKSATHIKTNAACESCHKSTTSFASAKFTHQSVTPGSCASCHNGGTAVGKPQNHLATVASCDTCHKTSGWKPASGFEHTGINSGCVNCHKAGGAGLAKPSNHIPTAGACETCHQSTASFANSAMNHTGIVTGCASCHSGAKFAGVTPAFKPTNHIK